MTRSLTTVIPAHESQSRPRAALAGLLAAGAALGAGEFTAGLVRRFVSPIEAVAEEFIDVTPSSMEQWAIRTFGENDKLVLIVGAVVTVCLFGALLGLVSRRRPAIATGGVVLLGVVAATASVAFTGDVLSAVPSVVAVPAGLFALGLLTGHAPTIVAAPATDEDADGTELPRAVTDRRWFLRTAAGVGAAAAAAAVVGRQIATRFSAVASRAAVILPGVRSPLPAPAPGVTLGVDGISPYYTPADEFYRVDTALSVPQVPTEGWTLRIHGMVDQERTYTYDELLARDLVEADITLTCVSNTVGGDLLGHARWTGIPLAELLDEAGVRPDADQVVGRSVDDWTGGFPVQAAYDRETLVVVGMNGEPLPIDRGFPARLIVPGLYGYVSATKWLQDIELTRFDQFDQYWVQRGWVADGTIKTQCRIDTPQPVNTIEPGPRQIGGVAWAQTRGISMVEVKVDDGPWEVAELGEQFNTTSWRQWRLPWDATPGAHRITVRATDGTGALQTDERTDPYPSDATGWHSLFVSVAG